MGAIFESANSDHLTGTLVLAGSLDLTIGCWFKQAAAAANQTMISVADGSVNNELHQIGTVSGPTVGGQTVSGDAEIISPDNPYAADTWHLAVYVISAADLRRMILDGDEDAAGEGTDSLASFNVTGYSIGRLFRASPGFYFNGPIAEAFIYGAALTAAESTLLRTRQPHLVRPDDLLRYFELRDGLDGENDVGDAPTNSGVTFDAGDHPVLLGFSATSQLSRPIQYLRNLVAACPTFQQITGAASASAAEAFIHEPEAEDREDPDDEGEILSPRPRCVIPDVEGQTDELRGAGEWKVTGELDVCFEFDIPSEYIIDEAADDAATRKAKLRDAKQWFLNQVGAIRGEMQSLAGGSDGNGKLYLAVRGITTAEGFFPGPEDEHGRYGWAGIVMTVRWV